MKPGNDLVVVGTIIFLMILIPRYIISEIQTRAAAKEEREYRLYQYEKELRSSPITPLQDVDEKHIGVGADGELVEIDPAKSDSTA